MAGFSEIARQLTHIFAGSFALLLRWTNWWQAALLAIAALLFNVLILPVFGKTVFRPGDMDRLMRSGIVIYPLSVLALILCFPHRPDIVAVSWIILAVGDGLATMVGAHVRTAPLPWNRAKSVGGLLAFVIGASMAGVAIAWWTSPGMSAPPPYWFLVGAPITAALVAGFVETVPIGLNDNISVPFSAAFVMWTLTLVDKDTVLAMAPVVVNRLPAALVVNIVFGVLGWRARTVTVAGAVTGSAIGLVTWLGCGLPGWLMLFATFAVAAATTRLGHQRKTALGIAEERGGRRGPDRPGRGQWRLAAHRSRGQRSCADRCRRRAERRSSVPGCGGQGRRPGPRSRAGCCRRGELAPLMFRIACGLDRLKPLAVCAAQLRGSP